MKKSSFFVISIYSLIILFSCNSPITNIPKNIQSIIDKEVKNRQSLMAVIEHYNKKPQDSLKLKALYFLITNMQDSYYYQGDLLDHYLDYFKLIKRDEDHGEYFMKSFTKQYGAFSVDKLNIHYDLEEITPEQFIGNIDMAFKVWKEQPWGKDISFDQFCEYILPFRIGDEIPEYNRENIYAQYNKVLDSVIKVKGDAIAACKVLNDTFIKQRWLFTHRIVFLPHFSASKLIQYRVGSCRDMADLATFTMRAVGIPVGNDFIHQWPYHASGHNWNVVLGKDGKTVMFLGAEDSPGTPHVLDTKKGKIFRQTFAKNPQSLAMIKGDSEIIPAFLLDPRITDVTDQYVKCYTVNIPVVQTLLPAKHAYICVYDSKKWEPIDWGNIGNNATVKFNKMEGDIIYMAGYYRQSSITPASLPFLLTKTGEVKYLQADSTLRNKSMTLTRIYPILPEMFQINDLIGGIFQGANQPDFKDAVTLYTINSRPHPFWNNVNINNLKKYRYIRYLSSPGHHCNVGEIEFYTKSKVEKLKGKLIGTDDSHNDADRTLPKAADGNIETFFEAKPASGGWAGMDFKRPIAIDRIKFTAAMKEPKGASKNPKGLIIVGHKYQLFYWDKIHQWVSIGENVAKINSVVFNRIPSNALYKLKDETENVDARIFTYDNGRQSWW